MKTTEASDLGLSGDVHSKLEFLLLAFVTENVSPILET